jgi:Tol biopolymer transport system component
MMGMIFVPGVAAQTGDSPSEGTIVFQTVSGGPIYVINADGNNLRYLTNGMDPALSPDGQSVAFTRWDDTQHGAFGGLWLINLDGTSERVILENVRQPKAPVWSPDGAKIAISMQRGGRLETQQRCSNSLPSEPIDDTDEIRMVVEVDGDGEIDAKLCYTLLPHPNWSLRLVDVATGEFEDLPGDFFSYAPAWDPANDWRLVYDGERGLVNLDLTRSEGATWALTEDPNDHAPSFSPDGRAIAVSYWQHDHWEIHVMNADTPTGTGGSGRARLTETPLRAIVEQRIDGDEPQSWNNVAPAWSPDGSQIAFLTDRTGRWEVWVMKADGSNQRPMFPDEVNDQLQISYNSVDERVISWEEN